MALREEKDLKPFRRSQTFTASMYRRAVKEKLLRLVPFLIVVVIAVVDVFVIVVVVVVVVIVQLFIELHLLA